MTIDWESIWPGLEKAPRGDPWVENYVHYWAKPDQPVDTMKCARLQDTHYHLHVFPQYLLLHDRIRTHRETDQRRRTLQPWLSAGRDEPVVILGNPGIGKSVFLLYLAARLMTEQTPFVLKNDIGYFVFTSGGVFLAASLPRAAELLRLFNAAVNIPLLLDIDSVRTLPPESIFRSSNFFIVQASSPKPENYAWIKQRYGAAVFVMNPHPVQDVVDVFKSIAPHISKHKIRLVYEAYGPNLRILMQVLLRDLDPGPTIKAAVDSLNWRELRNPAGADGTTYQTHLLIKSVCYEPTHLVDPLVHTIANPTVMRYIVARWSAVKSKETLDMLRRLTWLPHTGASAGWLFEAWVHAAMCTRGSVTLHRLTKSTGGVYELAEDAPETLTFPILPSATFRGIDEVNKPNTYYIPVAANHPTFDGFCSLNQDDCAFQTTLASTHSLSKTGLVMLQKLMSRVTAKKRFIFVVPTGRQFTYKPRVNVPIAGLTFWVMYIDLEQPAKSAIEAAYKEVDRAQADRDEANVDEMDSMDEGE